MGGVSLDRNEKTGSGNEISVICECGDSGPGWTGHKGPPRNWRPGGAPLSRRACGRGPWAVAGGGHGWTALHRAARGVCLARLPAALGQLFFSHTETFASGYWLGRGSIILSQNQQTGSAEC